MIICSPLGAYGYRGRGTGRHHAAAVGDRIGQNDFAVSEKLLELRGGFGTLSRFQKGFAPHIDRMKTANSCEASPQKETPCRARGNAAGSSGSCVWRGDWSFGRAVYFKVPVWHPHFGPCLVRGRGIVAFRGRSFCKLRSRTKGSSHRSDGGTEIRVDA